MSTPQVRVSAVLRDYGALRTLGSGRLLDPGHYSLVWVDKAIRLQIRLLDSERWSRPASVWVARLLVHQAERMVLDQDSSWASFVGKPEAMKDEDASRSQKSQVQAGWRG
jgi:hypothetical protein